MPDPKQVSAPPQNARCGRTLDVWGLPTAFAARSTADSCGWIGGIDGLLSWLVKEPEPDAAYDIPAASGAAVGLRGTVALPRPCRTKEAAMGSNSGSEGVPLERPR